MRKMEICLSFTYSQMAKKIGYNKFTEFENTVYKLQDICKKLEIIITSVKPQSTMSPVGCKHGVDAGENGGISNPRHRG